MNPSTTNTSTGFTFGLTPSSNAFSFGSSPFGANKPTLGFPAATSTASATASTAPSTQPATTTGSVSSTFGSPGSFAFGLQMPKPTLATASTTSSGLTFGIPATTSTGFGLSSSSAASTQPSIPSLGTSAPTLGSGFSFGQPSTTSVPSLFKQPTSLTTGTTASPFTLPTATTTTSSATALPSFGLSQPLATTGSTAGLTTSAPATSGTLSLLGAASTATTTTPFSSGLTSTSVAAPPSLGLGLSSSSLFPTPSSTTGLGTLASITPSTAITATSTTPASTTAAAPTTTSLVPQTLTYNQLEDLINKWTHELDEHERYFLAEANRINQWDNTLISNAEQITAIYEKVEHCQEEQTRLGQELDFIEGQQRELESLLEPLERAANELPAGQLHSDYEREAIFQLSTNVDLELGQLLNDLREIAGQTNATNASLNGNDLATGGDSVAKAGGVGKASAGGDGDVMQQITRILNCHMHSLNWIHHNTQEIMDRLKVLNCV